MNAIKVLSRVALIASIVAVALFWLPGCVTAFGDGGASTDSITIVVTDSGLGGLSVVADLERRLRGSGTYKAVDLIFFNALFSAESGYNSLPSREGKIIMFDRALQAIRMRYEPDVILVACNTLSVLYRDTPFAAEASTPVVDIVQGGVELIAECLADDSAGTVLVFGTETTIEEGAHLAALAARGAPMERVVTQSCPQLAAYIEQDVDGAATDMLVDAYVDEALAAAGDHAGIYVSFNCTHYGYALDAWRRAFANHGVTVSGFLDPNATMADVVLGPEQGKRHSAVEVKVQAVSMIEIPEATIANIGGCLKSTSPATAEALRRYELRPDLFAWQDVLSAEGTR